MVPSHIQTIQIFIYRQNFQEDFEFRHDIFDLCQRAMAAGYLIIVITNQSGIARGYYTQEDFIQLTKWMVEQFKERGITITKVYHCPHHIKGTETKFTKQCNCRKPEPGMLLTAANDFNLDLTACLLVGDKISDVEAGLNAGVKNNYLLTSQYPENSSILCKRVKSLHEILFE